MKLKTNVFFLESQQKFSSTQEALISKVIKEHSTRAAKILRLSGVLNFTVYPNKDWCIPQTGDGGYTAGKDWIQLSIDLSIPNKFKRIAENSLPATIYHEMHHAKRMATVGYGDQLLEVVITEGLASVFAEDMFPKFKTPWGKYSVDEIRDYLNIFLGHVNDKKYNHVEWFFGEGKPYWLGYKVGIYIIRGLKLQDPSLNCTMLVDKKAKKIFKEWRISNADLTIPS